MKICITRIDRMGDMILTLPIIKGLKILDKSNVIHVIASDRNYKIAKHFIFLQTISVHPLFFWISRVKPMKGIFLVINS